jgi:hypothetical protein
MGVKELFSFMHKRRVPREREGFVATCTTATTFGAGKLDGGGLLMHSAVCLKP